jgi:hypothetical protein
MLTESKSLPDADCSNLMWLKFEWRLLRESILRAVLKLDWYFAGEIAVTDCYETSVLEEFRVWILWESLLRAVPNFDWDLSCKTANADCL